MMALKDHFSPPLSLRRHWHSFYEAWATYIASELDVQLPEGYFVETNVQLGIVGIEIDLATLDATGTALENDAEVQLQHPAAWRAAAPTLSVPISMVRESVEVTVYSGDGGPTLAGAIELVSPANKDRPENRDALVSKCAAYLQQGIGLVLVDVVTARTADLHDALLARVGSTNASPAGDNLFAASYRPISRDAQPSLDIWHEPLVVGRALPTLPLWLRGGLCLALELDATYQRTCQEQRVAG